MLRRVSFVPVIVITLALVAAACGSDNEPSSGGTTGGGSAGGGATVTATEKDFAIALDSSQAGAGAVTFSITNDGPSVHEFVVFKTDLAPDQLPLANGSVDEEGQGVEHIDEVEDIAVGSTQTLNVNLDAGKYVVICNIAGHYAAGMHAPLTIGG
jgi:uncharacterized cupredoxin-like copper-binding protein